MMAAAAKADALKEEYEEETAKFEACQVSTLLPYCRLRLFFFTKCSCVKIVIKLVFKLIANDELGNRCLKG